MYAKLLLDYLDLLWPGGLSSLLKLHVTGPSLAVGYGASLAVTLLTIWWATRVLAKLAPRALLAGETIDRPGRLWASICTMLFAPIAAMVCLIIGFFSTDHEAQAGSFFGSGLFALTAMLAGLWWWMRSAALAHSVRPSPSLAKLGVRNASRHPVRSILTVGLLAAASFMVVAVQAFHRDPNQDFLKLTGGSGGYAWIGEATVPIFQISTPRPGARNYICRRTSA